MRKPPVPNELAARVPPGQHLVEDFPFMSYGPTPRFNRQKWDFRVLGLVEEQLRFSYQEFRALPLSRQRADFHCVTTWSKLDNLWEGVRVVDLMTRVRLKPEARYVVVHCDRGYTTNLPLVEFVCEEAVPCSAHQGGALLPEHWHQLRLVMP